MNQNGRRPTNLRLLLTRSLGIAICVSFLVACRTAAPAAPATEVPTPLPATSLPTNTTVPPLEPSIVTTPEPTSTALPPTEPPLAPVSTIAALLPTSTPLTISTGTPVATRQATPVAAIVVAPSPTRAGLIPKPPPTGHPVIINANLFPALDQTRLKAGDIFKGQAVRFGAPEVPLSRATFLKGVSELNTISTSDTQRLGLSKEIVFSSIQDLQTYLADPQLPSDVDYVEYDFEGVMTPASEYGNPVGAASQFADIAHSHGKKVAFTPIVAVLNKLQANGGLGTILSKFDIVVYQGQKQLPNLGPSGFAGKVQNLHGAVAGTKARLAVQLWTTINGCDTMATVFNSSQGTIDLVAIGTHDDGPGAGCVLTALRG